MPSKYVYYFDVFVNNPSSPPSDELFFFVDVSGRPPFSLSASCMMLFPNIVLEGAGVFDTFGRSHQLVRGRGWHVFGTLVLAWLILLAVNLILGLIFAALPDALGRGLSSVISGTIVAPFIALVVTLVYYRLSATAETSSVPGENYGGYGQTP